MFSFDLFPMGKDWLFDVFQLWNAGILSKDMMAKRLWNKIISS